ncbi:MAG: hypothetical protein ACR2L8_02925 [Solirubrobacteraceae bacterium]
MRTKQVRANETRFPEPEAGEAIVVSKYGDDRRKAVILHPDDFDLFERYRRIFAVREPYEMRVSDTAVAAHDLGERGIDEPDLDVESLDRALA